MTAVNPFPSAATRDEAACGLIRIAYIVYRFQTGGLERCVARLCNHLDRDRFRPVVICLERNGNAADWIDRDDVRIIELHKQPNNDAGAVWRLSRLLRTEQVDIVHSHNWGTLLETAVARRWAGVKSFVHAERGTVLSSLESGSLRVWLRAKAARWAMEQADVLVSNAESIRERINDRCGIPKERVCVIPNGVEIPELNDRNERRQRVRERLGIRNDEIVFGSVGRLVAVKDFGTAVHALSRLCSRGHRSHLVLVGDGPERFAIANQVQELRLQNCVHLVGEQSDVTTWLAMMDVYVNSSLSEGMSQSILEAMAIGLPLVVTDVGDNAALLGENTACGLLISSGDAAAMAASFEQLITHPSLRNELGNRARDRHRRCYSTDQMVYAYESLYHQLSAAKDDGR